jgi:alkylhydroperoxidase family enzyme
LEYTDRFATDHLSIDDAMFDRLRAELDEGEIVELTMAIARHLAFGRLTKVLELDQVCALDLGGEDKGVKAVDLP